jgi:hydrogenase maturation protein HypF
LPVSDVYHHHAHASAAYAEALIDHPQLDELLVFTWDGVGLGPDDSLWGGEALVGKPREWKRLASIRPFHLPGGERAGREPWRSAAAICWESEQECLLQQASDPLLRSFWRQRRNSPKTSAIGRLFDAAAALSGVCSQASFEGQGPMLFEAEAARHKDMNALERVALPSSRVDGVYIADWAPLVQMLADESLTISKRAAGFHSALAHMLLDQASKIRGDTGVNHVAVAGGVFQNRVLTELAVALLTDHGFEVSLPLRMPVNDAGISFGQIVEYGYQP